MVDRRIGLRVAVAHPYMGRGGSEAAALWGIQALRRDYRVTLLTAGNAKWDDLNACYGTDLRPADVEVRRVGTNVLVNTWMGAAAVRGALHQRYCRAASRSFGVMVSAYNLCDFGVPGIHLIADLSWSEELRQQLDPSLTQGSRLIHRPNLLRRGYLRLSRMLSHPTGRDLFGGEDAIVANSQWTSKLIQAHFGYSRCEVLYPPVVEPGVSALPELREAGFVCLGRVSHEKRIERIIEILSRVRALGHDTHLHIIGEIDDTPYGRMVDRLCKANAGWIIPEGRRVGADKDKLLVSHRFGIHGRPQEPFGIAVAEMVKVGCIPFVPDDGGQVEIVDHPMLTYANVDDAVGKIDRVLRDEAMQCTLRTHLRKQGELFSAQRFMSEFRTIVEKFTLRRQTAREAVTHA